MKRYTINTFTFDIKKSHQPLGLNFNRIGMVIGFTIESNDINEATYTLNIFNTVWNDWVFKYNTWVTDQKRKKIKQK